MKGIRICEVSGCERKTKWRGKNKFRPICEYHRFERKHPEVAGINQEYVKP